ncbi:hypothetical protein [Bartonella capreoli]|uniref:hypothetical protein n=1 Tax=Bartonella capreoli TaxID=155192 RepID=UPI001ABCEDE2|nr:hypothetical protein [Bartonella capreoli]
MSKFGLKVCVLFTQGECAGKEEDVWERGNWERGVGCYCGVCLVGEGMRLSAFEEWCELVGTVVGSVARGERWSG